MKTYTNETIKLRASELLLKSKGFMLFTVEDNGELMICAGTSSLNPAEIRGLDDWRYEDFCPDDFDGEK
jgi:hypothetical protein